MNFSEIFLNNGLLSFPMIIGSLYIATIVGTVIYYLVSYRLSKIVSAIIAAGADSPETAVTMEEILIKCDFFTKMCLKSHANYKNLLVAITADGKYYANMRYSDEPPTFKTFRAITRKTKSRISENEKNSDNNFSDNTAKTVDKCSVSGPDIAVTALTPSDTPQKITFNPFTAKYYLPNEVSDRAKGMFKATGTNVLLIVGALILMGVVIYFAGSFASAFLNSMM